MSFFLTVALNVHASRGRTQKSKHRNIDDFIGSAVSSRVLVYYLRLSRAKIRIIRIWLECRDIDSIDSQHVRYRASCMRVAHHARPTSHACDSDNFSSYARINKLSLFYTIIWKERAGWAVGRILQMNRGSERVSLPATRLDESASLFPRILYIHFQCKILEWIFFTCIKMSKNTASLATWDRKFLISVTSRYQWWCPVLLYRMRQRLIVTFAHNMERRWWMLPRSGRWVSTWIVKSCQTLVIKMFLETDAAYDSWPG